MKGNILIFGGTVEGRLLCEACSKNRREAVVCTATAYGSALVHGLPHIRVHSERMTTEAMAGFIASRAFSAVVDATHPYARDVTRNIREACAKAGRAYIRIAREERESPCSSGIRSVPDMDAAVDYLAGTFGNVLLTTGSKALPRFRRLPDFARRLYVRVLPDAEVIRACNDLGFAGERIIAMQGPFSHDLNLALLRQCGCAFLVTKNTGRAGGLDEKISAALEAGAEVILVERPEKESGYTLDEALALLGLPPKENT